MAQCNESNVHNILAFLSNAPCDEEIVAMDCNDYCEQLAQLAEDVAAGADLKELLPALEEHMRHYTDCREEFEALVAVLQAQKSDTADEKPSPPASE
jgi:hypothetical protein